MAQALDERLASLLLTPEFLDDPCPAYDQLREESPILESEACCLAAAEPLAWNHDMTHSLSTLNMEF